MGLRVADASVALAVAGVLFHSMVSNRMIKHREALPRSYLPASLEDEHFWVFVFGVLDLMEVYIYIYI